MRSLFVAVALAALAATAAQEVLDAAITVPINKDGERYALLDFYQKDSEYVIRTARQFCVDHGFGDTELRAIVEHTLAEIAKVTPGQAAPEAQPAPAATTSQPASPGLPQPASQLLGFMKANGMNAAAVMKSLAMLMEQGHTA